jgi:D-tyrosyl-tRNA(Tyr) deacylase
MRALIQRVTRAEVLVEERVIGECDAGLLVLACAMRGDTDEDVAQLARKIPKLRMFNDESGKTNVSLLQTGGEMLIVSQFTLAADTQSGNRPGFSAAAPPEEGRAKYEAFIDAIRAQNIGVQTGQFGAAMEVSLVNDGPFTIWMDTRA